MQKFISTLTIYLHKLCTFNSKSQIKYDSRVSGLGWSSVSPNCQLCVLSFRICFATAARLFTTSILKFCSGSDSPEIAWPLTAGLSSTHTTPRSIRSALLNTSHSDELRNARPS